MKVKNTILIITSIFTVILLTLVVVALVGVSDDREVFVEKKTNYTEPMTIQQINARCSGMTLENTSKCFVDNVNTFFEYNEDMVRYYLDEDGRSMIYNFSTPQVAEGTTQSLIRYLKENGGTCTEWALLYKQLCEKTNFRCDTVSNSGIEGIFYGHEYTVMSDSTHYCNLDQSSYSCRKINLYLD